MEGSTGGMVNCPAVTFRDRGGQLRNQFWGNVFEFVRGIVVLECIKILEKILFVSQVTEGGSVSHRTNHILSWGLRNRAAR